jgi:hypothetical protein
MSCSRISAAARWARGGWWRDRPGLIPGTVDQLRYRAPLGQRAAPALRVCRQQREHAALQGPDDAEVTFVEREDPPGPELVRHRGHSESGQKLDVIPVGQRKYPRVKRNEPHVVPSRERQQMSIAHLPMPAQRRHIAIRDRHVIN